MEQYYEVKVSHFQCRLEMVKKKNDRLSCETPVLSFINHAKKNILYEIGMFYAFSCSERSSIRPCMRTKQNFYNKTL